MEQFIIAAVLLLHPGADMLDDFSWSMAEDGSYSMEHWDADKLGPLNMSALESKAQLLLAESQLVQPDQVNLEILENLKLIWGGDTETRVAQKHQNAVGIMTRLLNKEGSEQTALTSEEMAIKDSIQGQLEAHEAVLNEGRRIKALSLIPADYKTLLQAVL